MANILFEYMYRDASNWKKHGEAVFTNESGIPLAEIEARIRKTQYDGEWFKAEMVGLETCFFNPPEEQTEDDHPWHEFERVSETDRPPSDPACSACRDIAEFLRAMEIGKARSWEAEKKVCCMCDQLLTGEELENCHDLHRPDCARVRTAGKETFAGEIFCDCDLVAHAHCCPCHKIVVPGRCVCCDRPTDGTYDGEVPVCLECYQSGKLLIWLANCNTVTAGAST